MARAEQCRCRLVAIAIIWATLACPIASAAPIRAQNVADRANGSVQTLAAIIEQVRVNEAKYRDLEIVAKTSGSHRSTPYAIGWTFESTSTSVYDGDRFYLHLKKETKPDGLRPARTEVLAAFDGQKTRSVVSENCANIYLGRREPGAMVPPHSWVLGCWGVDFSLSSLLSGTEGLRDDPKTPAYGKGFANSFVEVVCEVDGEEVLDGLRCFRIRCREDRGGVYGQRFTYLWIAPDRNFLCVRLKVTGGHNVAAREHPWLESSVRAWKTISGDRWLPARIETQWFDQDRKTKAWHVVATQSQNVENVVFGAKHEDRFFREIEFPKDVPVFTIQDGQPVDDVLKTARPVTNPDDVLHRVTDALRHEEQRFSQLEVRAHAKWFDLDDAPSPGRARWTRNAQFHFVVCDGHRYYENSWNGEGADGEHASGVWISTYDGKWTRSVNRFMRASTPHGAVAARRARGRESAAPNVVPTETRAAISLGVDEFSVIRPHKLFFDGEIVSHAAGTLSDYLSTGILYRGSGDVPTRRAVVTYLGEDRRGSLECHVVQFLVDPHSGDCEVVWLAKDRNLIPVRYEWRRPEKNRSLPLAFGQVDEMREIEKGVWFPTKVSESASVHFKWTRNRIGRVQFDWRRNFVVDEVNRNPIFPKDADAKLTIPKGTELTVTVPGKGTVTVRQEKTGLAAVSPDAWRRAIFELILRRSNRIREIDSGEGEKDALVGTRLPPLPKGTWINTRPLTWDDDLYGRVVVLHFFAEQVSLCEPDLRSLAHDVERLTKQGIVVLGVHPPAAIEPVTKLASKLGLKYPICIDASPPDWSASWGRLGDACDLRFVPTAVVLGRDGTIYGRGTLGHVLRLAEKALQDHGQRRNLRPAIKSRESH